MEQTVDEAKFKMKMASAFAMASADKPAVGLTRFSRLADASNLLRFVFCATKKADTLSLVC